MEAINLQGIFSNSYFRIPDYQRGYAWEQRQLGELWDDISDIRHEDGEYKKHYTGTIFVEKTVPSEDERWLTGAVFYNVVDGQQRLTTISILLFELLSKSDIGYGGQRRSTLIERYLYTENTTGASRSYKFSYEQTDKNYHFLLNKIFGDKSVLLNSKEINKYSNNLLAAKTFFSEKIDMMADYERDELFIKITSALYFDIRSIEKDLDVQAVFETINNRGKPLSVLEKLKNRLIYLTDKLQCPKEDKSKLRKKINSVWGNIYTYLGKNPEYLLDEDEFLSAHLSLYRRPAESVFSEKAAEEKIFQMFCNKAENFYLDDGQTYEPPVSFSKIDEYISQLDEAAPLWFDIHNSNNLLVKKILLLNKSKDLKIFLLSVMRYSNQNDGYNFQQILSNAEILLFRNRVLWLFDERSFATWARKLYKSGKMEDLTPDINELVNHKFDEEEIIKSFNNLYTYQRGNKGFHRWGALKYFLFEYDEKLRIKFREENTKISIDDYYETTIEHVIPQHYHENWPEVVQAIASGITDEDYDTGVKVILNSLGNLTILKNGKNSSLGNSGWAQKKERFSTGSYNEIDISKKENWGKDEMFSRGHDLVDFLEEKVTGIKFTQEQKNKLLYYSDDIINQMTCKAIDD